MPDRRVPVEWQVAHDEHFRWVVRAGTYHAVPELAHSVHVEADGLEPGRHYFYRFRAGGVISPVGRTRTAPPPEIENPGVSFAFVSCQQYEHGYYTAYRHLAEEDVDIVFHLGDYIYEDGAHVYMAPGGNVRRHDGPEVVTLEGYRNRHALYRSDEDLQAAHAAAPWVVTWDDHEVDNNYAGASHEGDGDRAAFLRRRAAAYQAYYEHMPLRAAAVPRGPDMRVYRRLSYGGLVAFYVLDTRQYRDDQVGTGRRPPGPRQRDPERSLLGERQERWLLDALAASSARWNVLAQQVFFAPLDFRAGEQRRLNVDSWDGYPAARDRVLRHLLERDVSNPVVVTGDVHTNFANELKADFADPDSRVLGVELVGTSVASGGDGSDTRHDAKTIFDQNPHVRFCNNHRGYVRCSVDAGGLRADYRVVPYVSRRGAPVTTRASFAVEDGNPGLHRVADNPVTPGTVTDAGGHDRTA